MNGREMKGRKEGRKEGGEEVNKYVSM